MDHEEARVCDNVSALVAARGREPGLEIPIGGRTALLTHWARAITDRLEPVCAVLDEGHLGVRRPYIRAQVAGDALLGHRIRSRI